MLTDLEAAAIGTILTNQPCTAHRIRTCFRESLAKQFSDSKGSVYPMMKRLEKRQTLKGTRQKEGQRFVRYYCVTAEGKAKLQGWLESRFEDIDLLTTDPLRTRMLYLNRLPKSRRAKWFDGVEHALNEKLVEIKRQFSRIDSTANDSVFKQLAIENAIIAFQARLKWLDKARAQLKSEGLI